MKSIRLSLIVYFLVLLTMALGAVSWFSYQTASQALRDRQADSRKMIVAQCENQIQAVRADVDRRILRQAQTMASMVLSGNESRSMLANTEGLAPFGAIGAAMMPNGYFHIPIWMSQGTYVPWMQEGKYPMLAREIFSNQPVRTFIDPAEDLIPQPDKHHGQEYFQTFRHNGNPMQRSKSMGEHSFVLNEHLRAKALLLTDSFVIDDPLRTKAAEFNEAFDEIEIKPGVKVRRVTLMLKVRVSPWPYVNVAWPWRNAPFGPSVAKFGSKGSPLGKGPRLGGAEASGPMLFIQYASNLAPPEARIHEYQTTRDEQLAELETTVSNDLRQLRSRMFWIAFGTLAAVWIGGYILVRLGLKPLSQMSEAVRQVSVQNFHLPLEPRKLPAELQPIAATLIETLDQLRKAFDREKQAAADISHELRTPLAALMTTLEVGMRKSRSVDEYREILEDCHSSGRHMYQLVQRLLALARLDAGADQYQPAPVDAIDLALQCADMIRPLAKARGLEMRLHLPDPVILQTDPNQLREVLTNLLHNAVEYNKPNGSIELSVEQHKNQARIEVRDTGIGIAPDALGHIFERFYRADPSRHADTPHAGLGLAIVKSYIDRMGGSIHVASNPGGTTFTIELPIGDVSSLSEETGIRAESALMRR